MAYYTYKVKDQNGRVLSGKIEANSTAQAAITLKDKGYFVIKIQDLSKDFVSQLNISLERVSFADVVNFTRQLATMINAGLSLTNSLSILIEQSKSGLAVVLSKVLSDVESGSALYQAFEKHPKIFDKTYVQLVRAGELSGTLDQILIRLADNMETEKEFKSKVKGAMIYPAFIFATMIIAVVVVMVVVVPKLMQVFTEMNAELPTPTKILIAMSEFTQKFWWVGLIFLGILFAGFKVWLREEKSQIIFDKFLFQLPVFGKLRKKIVLTEFTRTFSLLLKSGINLVEALDVVAEGIDSILFRKHLIAIREKVEKGVSLGEALSLYPDFPPLIYQMVAVGEQTGKLDAILDKVAQYYHNESESAVNGLMKAMEPAIMLVIGVGVGFLAFAILMPIYDLTNQIAN